jgi:hypothetical protein
MQVKTSPGETSENFRRVTEVLGAANINIDGIGPDFTPPHVRTVLDHGDQDAAWAALDAAGLKPVNQRAVLVTLDNASGKLRIALEHLARRGCTIESVLVLAARSGDKVRVSIGVSNCMEDDWEDTSHAIATAIDAEASG